MNIRIMIGITCLLLISSCFNSKTTLPDWLPGTWKNETSRGTIFETWTKENELMYKGSSYSLSNGDTTVYETIKLLKDKNTILYIPTVNTQNEAKPVRFTAKLISSDKLIFENPTHDFPQIITYTRVSADSLVAEISGMINGEKRIQRFPMKRLKTD